jgi:hypothetical protein
MWRVNGGIAATGAMVVTMVVMVVTAVEVTVVVAAEVTVVVEVVAARGHRRNRGEFQTEERRYPPKQKKRRTQ